MKDHKIFEIIESDDRETFEERLEEFYNNSEKDQFFEIIWRTYKISVIADTKIYSVVISYNIDLEKSLKHQGIKQ